MPTTAVELPYPNADIVKLPSMIIPKKLGFFIHQNIKKVGVFSMSPRVAPYHGEKTIWPLPGREPPMVNQKSHNPHQKKLQVYVRGD